MLTFDVILLPLDEDLVDVESLDLLDDFRVFATFGAFVVAGASVDDGIKVDVDGHLLQLGLQTSFCLVGVDVKLLFI